MGCWVKFLPNKQHWDAKTLLPMGLFHPEEMSKSICSTQAAASAPHCLQQPLIRSLLWGASAFNSISFYHAPCVRWRNPSIPYNPFWRPSWKMYILYTALCNLWETGSKKSRVLGQPSGRGECETSGIAPRNWDPTILKCN